MIILFRSKIVVLAIFPKDNAGAIFQREGQTEEKREGEGERLRGRSCTKSENYKNEVGGYRIIASGRTSRRCRYGDVAIARP